MALNSLSKKLLANKKTRRPVPSPFVKKPMRPKQKVIKKSDIKKEITEDILKQLKMAIETEVDSTFIRDKLESLKGARRLSANVIKDIPSPRVEMKRSVGAGSVATSSAPTEGDILVRKNGNWVAEPAAAASLPVTRVVTGSETLLATDELVLASADTATLTLPDASTLTNGKSYLIKWNPATPTSLTLNTAGGNIDGAASYAFPLTTESKTLYVINNNYYLY